MRWHAELTCLLISWKGAQCFILPAKEGVKIKRPNQTTFVSSGRFPTSKLCGNTANSYARILFAGFATVANYCVYQQLDQQTKNVAIKLLII
jgi:hypothetical protein